MKLKQHLVSAGLVAASMAFGASTAFAACATDGMPASKDGPGGYPERALTMIVPYGPAGGSGQVAQAMAQAVSDLTGVSINRDHKPGGSGRGAAGLAVHVRSSGRLPPNRRGHRQSKGPVLARPARAIRAGLL